MENQNVSLDRCPREKDRLRVVEAPVDGRPYRAEYIRIIPERVCEVEVDHPQVVGYLIEKSDTEDDGHGMIVKGTPQSPAAEEVVQNEYRANDGENEKAEEQPQLERFPRV